MTHGGGFSIAVRRAGAFNEAPVPCLPYRFFAQLMEVGRGAAAHFTTSARYHGQLSVPLKLQHAFFGRQDPPAAAHSVASLGAAVAALRV